MERYGNNFDFRKLLTRVEVPIQSQEKGNDRKSLEHPGKIPPFFLRHIHLRGYPKSDWCHQKSEPKINLIKNAQAMIDFPCLALVMKEQRRWVKKCLHTLDVSPRKTCSQNRR